MQTINNGLYWVLVKSMVGVTLHYDWAIGIVREGHFEWFNRYAFDGRQGLPTGINLAPITLQELQALKVPMVEIIKPKTHPYLTQDVRFLGENI